MLNDEGYKTKCIELVPNVTKGLAGRGGTVLLLKLIVAFVMYLGLGCTLVPRVPGTVIILLGALVYGAFTNFTTFEPWQWAALFSLVAVAEIGGRVLRIYLTRSFPLTRTFAASSTVGSIGGVVAADAMLGPLIGLIVWELVAGKTLVPRGNTVAIMLLRLAVAALLRFVCGLAMIVIVLVYIFQ